MNTPAEDVQAYLQDLNLIDGTSGWPSLTNYLPNTPDKVVVLSDTSGEGADVSFAYERLGVQVKIRDVNSTSADPYSKIMELFDVLQGATIGATYPLLVARAAPVDLGLDAHERAVFACTFRVDRTR